MLLALCFVCGVASTIISNWTVASFQAETCLLASFFPPPPNPAFTWALYFDQVFTGEAGPYINSTRMYYSRVADDGTTSEITTLELVPEPTRQSSFYTTRGVQVFVDEPRKQIIVVGQARKIWVIHANATSLTLQNSIDAMVDLASYFRIFSTYDHMKQRMVTAQYFDYNDVLTIYERNFDAPTWLLTTAFPNFGTPASNRTCFSIITIMSDFEHRSLLIVFKSWDSCGQRLFVVVVYDLDTFAYLRNISIPLTITEYDPFPNPGPISIKDHTLYLTADNETMYVLAINYTSATYQQVELGSVYNSRGAIQLMHLYPALGFLFAIRERGDIIVIETAEMKFVTELFLPVGGMSYFTCGGYSPAMGLMLTMTQGVPFPFPYERNLNTTFAGTVSTLANAFPQQVCEPGETNPLSCFPCAAGFRVVEEIVHEVQPLADPPLRTVQRRSCVSCDIYTYSPNISSSKCEPCATALTVGTAVCAPCPPGAQQDVNGTRCECSAGYALFGTQCVSCVPGSFKISVGSTEQCTSCWEYSRPTEGRDSCECIIGYFLAQPSLCAPCPTKGASCPGGKHSNIEGFWYHNTGAANQLEYLPCPNEESCLVSKCAEGYEGLLCGSCSPGFAPNSALEECVPCTSVNGALLVVSFILMMLLLGYFWTSKVGTSFLAIKILLNYLQFLGQVQITFPNNPLQFLLFFQLDFFADARACVAPMGALDSWAFHTFFIPCMLQFLAVLSFIALWLVKPCKLTREAIQAKYFRVVVMSMQFTYLVVLKRACMMVTCMNVLDEPRLFVDPGVVCWSDEHMISAVFAFLTIIVFACGFPFLLYLFIGQKLLPEFVKSQDPAFLVSGYKNQYQEVYALVRKFMVVIWFTICRSLPTLYFPWIMIVLFQAFLCYHMYEQPFVDNTNNFVEFLALLSLIVSFALELLVEGGERSQFPFVLFAVVNFLTFAAFIFVMGKIVFKRAEEKIKTSQRALESLPM